MYPVDVCGAAVYLFALYMAQREVTLYIRLRNRVPSSRNKPVHTYKSDKPGTKMVVCGVDTAPHGGETPTTGTPFAAWISCGRWSLPVMGAGRLIKFLEPDIMYL